MKLLKAAQVRELDRLTIEEIGIPGPVLMETAGRAVVEAVEESFADLFPGPVVVLAGKGNNGGDGYVIARTLLDRGWSVITVVLAPAAEIRGDARVHLRALKRCGGEVVHAASEQRLAGALQRAAETRLTIDAILGTGLTSEVRGLYLQAIKWCNAHAAPAVAVDIPSGVDADNGRILGAAVESALTVTFAVAKPGQACLPGAAVCGLLRVADIGIPAKLLDATPLEGEFVDAETAAKLLPERPLSGHKGNFGHLLVLAGARGKSGAALLASEGGLRSGAGLVTLAVPGSLRDVCMARLTEAMSISLPDSEGAVSSAAYEEVMLAMSRLDVLALGPGLGTAETTQLLVQRLVRDCEKPLVIDADGLNALVGHLDTLSQRSGVVPVITPHPGEMSRLTGLSIAAIEDQRLEVARRFAREQQVVVVLKGARTIVAAPDGRYRINGSGNPGLASGGMGDVLTGLIGGLLAQGLAPFDAASLGCYLHGMAADRLKECLGEAGMLAGDVARELPAARHALSYKGE